MKGKVLLNRIRLLLLFFIVSLFISGLTAIPVAPELHWLLKHLPENSAAAILFHTVLNAYMEVQDKYHFLLYGYDWLAFAHFVLAILFIGPYQNPIQNIWVIQFGLIACVLVIPFALIAGSLRGLPLWWRLGDCAFGVIGFGVLWACYKLIKQLKEIQSAILPGLQQFQDLFTAKSIDNENSLV
jgi:hypothetical protein